MKRFVLLLAIASLTAPTSARATISSIFDGDVTCAVQGDGERHCSGIFTTFDGAPIDINVGFPPAPASGPDGNFPIVGVFHGWGGSKLGPNTGWAYKKFSRRSQDWAIVGVAAVVEKNNGTIDSARIGLTSMGSTPIRASAVEEALSGASPDGVAEAAEAADEGTEPASDGAAAADFRRHLARVWTRRAVEEALSR